VRGETSQGLQAECFSEKSYAKSKNIHPYFIIFIAFKVWEEGSLGEFNFNDD
jgi:hypothetical protein